MSVILWFRRDLRLADNPALGAALATGLPVVAVYIHAPDEESPWEPGAASRWWLHQSLSALDEALRKRGGALVFRYGPSLRALEDLIAECGATHVFWNRLYEPSSVARDCRVKETLLAQGLAVESYNAALLFEPWETKTLSGDPYRVFTPFWRNTRARVQVEPPLAVPKRVLGAAGVASQTLSDLCLLPSIDWATGLRESWRPGEAGAHGLLKRFCADAIADYAEERDRPDHAGTSRISPHLHFGEIGPRQIVYALAHRGLLERGEAYVRELGWREFSHHLLFHYPHTTDAPLNAQFQRFPWAADNATLLAAWQRGRIGIPIVDAGMRELWHTGWMHNRVRMIAASLLTKNLRMHWLHGARWFWDTLVDADLPNNTQGWQWTAGSGADAAPYFRIFNPVTQGNRFDPDGAYVKRWIPELARVPVKFVHAPWVMPASQQQAVGVAGTVYAKPLLDLPATRDAALAAYQAMRSEA